jgi:hypothetical protein
VTSVHLLRFEETARSVTITPPSPVASATWEVHDLTRTVTDVDYVVASGVGAVDGAGEVLTVDAGPQTANARRLSMASTAGFASGGTYLISDTGGSETIEVIELATDSYLALRHPLAGTYTTANLAQVQGLTITAALPDSIAADLEHVDFDEPLRIVWTFTDGSKHQQQIRVVRQDESDQDLTGVAAGVRKLFPDVHTRIERDGRSTLADTIAEIYQDHRAVLLADGDDPSKTLHGEQGQRILVWATLVHLAAQGNAPGQDDPTVWLEHCSGQLKRIEGNTRRGPAGKHTLAVLPRTESAHGSQDPNPRPRITIG